MLAPQKFPILKQHSVFVNKISNVAYISMTYTCLDPVVENMG